ncbi:MAG: hypothetical protein ACK5QA_08820 [Dolichospermum sp.]|jgi:hypothetical protein
MDIINLINQRSRGYYRFIWILTQRDLIGAIIANELVELQLQKTNLVLSYRAFYICLNFRFLPLGLCVFAEYQNIHLRLVICICILQLKVLQPS